MNLDPQQLAFSFDDSPKGVVPSQSSDVSKDDDGSAQKLDPRRWQEKRPALEDRHFGLLERVAEREVLTAALDRVARNKGAPGPDRQSVQEVVAHRARILPALSASLLNGSYQPGDIRRCWIPKPSGGSRGLGIPNVVDRVVQEAVRQLLEPIFEPLFHPSSHGFRPGRGCHTAIDDAALAVTKDGHTFVVDTDLKSFFDRVHHQRLLDRLQRWVGDMKLIRLIGKMLRAKVVFPTGEREDVSEGVPQGGPLSPLLSNVVLDELDWELERRGHRFVRYADDCNIYVGSERAGLRVMDSTTAFIEKRLRLEVNREKSAVARAGERHFLGFRVSKGDDGEAVIELSARSVKRMAARQRDLLPRTAGRSMASAIADLNRYQRGWMAYFGICSDTTSVMQTFRRFDAHARRRLRASFVRRFRTSTHLFRALVARKAPRRAAFKAAFSRRGPWHLSHRLAVERALPNSLFRELGLRTLVDLWTSHSARTTAGPATAG